MECLNYKKGLTCSNYKCQFGYINCANFKYDIWDFNKCRNYNLEPSKDVTVEVKDGEQK